MGCTSDSGPGARALLLSRVEDTVRLSGRRGAPCYLGFLDESEQVAVRQALERSLTADEWALFGGYDGAERRLLAVFPSWLPPQPADYPLLAAAFHYRPEKTLTHRDFLGTLLSAGLRRETIGDILCGTGIGVVFLREEVAAFAADQVEKVGGEGVRIELGYTGPLPQAHRFAELRDTVASPRLDAVLAALLRVSREQAAQLIHSGQVEVDHQPEASVSRQLAAPCTVSVRGRGRFSVDRIGPPTKKGRLILNARKYL